MDERQPTLVRQAHDLTTDLLTPDARVYWFDLVASATLTYGGLFLAVTSASAPIAIAAGLVALFALYRGISFIHELTHLRAHEAPGFKLGWHMLVGVPFLIPSFLYEGVHTIHHAKDRYGTAQDPEYLPLSRYPPMAILGFLAVALLAPLGVILRFGIGTPLSFLVPPLRRLLFARYSAMTINPAFRREDVERASTPGYLAAEIGCWLWVWTVAGLVIAGQVPPRAVLIVVGIFSLATLLNQLRTAGAHAWENAGAKMTFAEQFADTVNVPPPGWLPFLWAPVGLRYHALHHLLPRLPYHNLGKAHARLVAALPAASPYHRVARKGLTDALAGLFARSKTRGQTPATCSPR